MTAESDKGGPGFAPIPPLEGVLAVDDASRNAVAVDLGNISYEKPSAVLRPRSAHDVAAMVAFCREQGISVAGRGQAHTTFGQGLSNGLVIENRCLDRIRFLSPDSAEVDAGVLWKDLTRAAYESSPRRTPPVLTGYTGLTVGGTLSVGGVGGIFGGLRTGLQIDHVRELEVVTGTGAVERCSPGQKSDLFEAMLGGLGQCGIITKATVDLVPARERARTYVFGHTDAGAFFRDLRAVIDRDGVDHVYAEFVAPGASPSFTLFATTFYDLSAPPDDQEILDGLEAAPEVRDRDYMDHVLSIDNVIDPLCETVGWDRLVKPWFDTWLPGSKLEDFFADVLPTLTPRDIGPYGAGLIYPQRRAHARRPLPRVPEPDGSEWLFAVDINTVSETPDPEPGFVDSMLARNRRLMARTRERHGGVLYPIGSVPLTRQEWREHYGDAWEDFHAAKERYDPDRVLTSGPGIFEAPETAGEV
ncbi:FAD-binding protein [Nocardiopsis algeriensis]|uniref:FAD/FMN-containing dehydrogenase n=1 Tax=Nocardiopsis algeriensis TaxID=1478215 RepID=A0A841IQV3_9ACTN|nr:FAD-binding protein [Nocardiopsis algeriensis]MBB6120590.1 FAD/FMN-containing dehydrogenase [Nocardiopsis algeriensis]